MTISRVLILGCGYTGRAVAHAARARGAEVIGSVRSEARALALRAEGFEIWQSPVLDGRVVERVDRSTHVVVAFQPDPATDGRIAPCLHEAGAITYVSSTGVYGSRSGVIDDQSELPPPDARAARILAAEAHYRAVGATVLRCPGIYGPDRGLHIRVIRGDHRIPGTGSQVGSRIHVEDLASLILATARVRGQTLVVGDLAPAPHAEVVRYICDAYGVAWPASVPIDAAPESLRADRSIDPRRALALLGVALRYPSYREGMAPSATSCPDR